MKNLIITNPIKFEKSIRQKFAGVEVFDSVFNVLSQSKFSTKLTYYNYKIQKSLFYSTIRNRCLLTNNPRNVYKFLRVSKFQLTRMISNGSLTGFYKSL